MKNLKFPLLGCTVIAAGLAMAQQQAVVGSLKHKSSPQFPVPAAADSTRGNENAFDPSSLLDSRAALKLAQTYGADWTTILPDTAGRYTLPASDKGARIHTLTTRLRAPHYAAGKLAITSTSRARVLADGKEIIRKTTADSTAVKQDAKLTLQPNRDLLLQVDIVTFPEDKASPEIRIEFIPDKEYENVALLMDPEMKRRLNTQDVDLGKRVRSVALSPDGKYLLMTSTDRRDATDITTTTTLSETATGKIISEDVPQGAEWLAGGGATLVFPRKSGDRFDLYTIDPANMRRSLLASGVPSQSVTVSPDRSYAVYYKEVKGEEETGIMMRVKDPDDRMPGNRDRAYLMKYDFASGISYPISAGGPSTTLTDISADGKKILYAASHFEADRYPLYFADLVEVDATTLVPDTLLRGVTDLNGAIYSPDARRIFVTAGPETFGDLGKNCGDHPIANPFDTQGYIFDISSRRATAATRDFNPSIKGDPVWNNDGKIYFTAADGFYSRLYRLDPSSAAITAVPGNQDYITSFSMGQNESKWIATVSTGDSYSGRADLVDLKSGKCTVISDPWKEELDMMNLATTKTWTFTAADGTVIDGTITLPPDFDPDRKYPLIVYYYGGTTPSTHALYHPYSPQVFASRDYVVYTINPSGTIGYGQEFSARHVNAWGERTADEIIEGTRLFCEEHPFVDASKIGCLGASYGGFMTMLLQTKTDLFAAAVSHAGISNVTSYWGEGYWGYSYNVAAAAKSYPWSNPEVYHRNSALLNADKIHTPLLLLHGTEDTNVPIGESIQLFNALRTLGRDVEFIQVKGANHVVTDFEQRRVWQDTIMAWFEKYLHGDSRWWNALYGK